MPRPSKFKELARYVQGYPKLAAQMAMLPEIAIFRRFGALNARNLLYLQAELTDLEAALMAAESRDSRHAKWKKQAHARQWHWLENSTCEVDEDTVQYNLVLKIREKLKEYNEALYYQSKIHKLEEPDLFDISDMQKFMVCELELCLIGEDRNIWGVFDEPNSFTKDGLVTLRPRARTDMFSSKISEYGIVVIQLVQRIFGKRPKDGEIIVTEGYHDSTISKITFWLTSIIASSIPVISIIALVNISSLEHRLAAIAGFNALISLCLLCFTEAKRTDIFAITAAFAAVQVVFVGQALETGPKQVMLASGSGGACQSCST